MDKINFENYLGQKLSRVVAGLNNIFLTKNNEILADEIIFEFEKFRLRILPIQDTDEIELKISESVTENLVSYTELELLNKFVGKKLTYTWNCINSNGYFDAFMISFDLLHPNLIILSEGSVLKIFETNQLSIVKVSKNKIFQ